MPWDKWPFYPLTLTQAFDPDETKARNLLRLIISGSSERIQKAMTIVEPHYTQDGKLREATTRVDHVNPREHFTLFCGKLREIKSFNEECIKCDNGVTLKLIKGLLFTMGLEFQRDLDNVAISEGLRREFKNNGILLSHNPTVSIKEKDSKWLITDNQQSYAVRKEENKLSVYNKRQLELVHRYKCIHKLIDYACPVTVYGRIVAVAFTGQFLPERNEQIIEQLTNVGLQNPFVAGKYDQSTVKEFVGKLKTEKECFEEYGVWAKENNIDIPARWDNVFEFKMFNDDKYEVWEERNQIDLPIEGEQGHIGSSVSIFGATIKHLGRIAEAQFRLHKRNLEREFFEGLRELFPNYALSSRNAVKEIANRALANIKEYWGVDWIALFCSPRQLISVPANPHLLEVFASIGVSQETREGIMHFNWRKAGFPTGIDEEKPKALQPLIIGTFDESKHQLERGLRGPKRESLFNAALLFPTFLSENYRAIVLVGTFAEDRYVQISTESIEIDWLQEIANFVASRTLSQLEMIDFDDDYRKWRNISTNLMHTSRRAIQPIGVGREIIQSYFDIKGVYNNDDVKEVLSSLRTATEIMATDVRRPIEVIAAWVEGKYNFQRASLAEIAEECAKVYTPLARERNVTIIVEENIRNLSEIEMDVTTVRTAIGDLLDNAIKYCHEETKIYIGGKRRDNFVEVYVDDFGLGIDDEDLDRIFNLGFQGARSRKALGKEGDGFGLYHAKTVVTVHEGDIGADCRTGPRSGQSRRLEGYRVIVTMKLPISQPKRR